MADLKHLGVAQISYAAAVHTRPVNKDASKVIKIVTRSSPTTARKMLKAYKKSLSDTQRAMTKDEALAMIIDNDVTVSSYKHMRALALDLKHDIYPSYTAILEAKKDCYPEKDGIIITETMAEVKLQQLLDHTASRLLINNNNLEECTNEELIDISVTYKWGFDGSTGHSQYKQRYSDGSTLSNDSSIFFTSIVPIKMETTNGKILFQNPVPSSTKYCRPIRFQFLKETTDISKNEQQYITDQIDDLLPTNVELYNREIMIKHKLILTMIDGKICNAITDTKSSQTCYICGAKPTEMNDIDSVLQRNVKESSLAYGLSTLHAWIRFFEYFLHIAYRLEFKTWSVRKPEHVATMKAKKKKFRMLSFRDWDSMWIKYDQEVLVPLMMEIPLEDFSRMLKFQLTLQAWMLQFYTDAQRF